MTREPDGLIAVAQDFKSTRVQLQSGRPFTITNQAARTNTGGTDRPNQVGDPTLSDPTTARWFDTSQFVA